MPEASLGHLVADQSRPRLLGRLIGRLVDAPGVGRPIARLMGMPMRVGAVTTRVTRFHAWLLRRTGGRLRRSWMFAAGQPVLALTTTGRKSGQPRTTTVACFTHGDLLAIAAMALGSGRNPAWALNLEADPEATIAFGGRQIDVTARRAAAEQAGALWRRWLELQPSADVLRDLSARDIPIFVLSRRSRR
jgi:deazaflavin-dependent oxidoreductase (nitroreductase family)